MTDYVSIVIDNSNTTRFEKDVSYLTAEPNGQMAETRP